MASKQGYSCLSDGSLDVPSSSPEGTLSLSPHSPGLCLISTPTAETHWLSSAPPQPESPGEMNVTLEKLLAPITEKLKYLLKKAEDFQTYLLYRWQGAESGLGRRWAAFGQSGQATCLLGRHFEVTVIMKSLQIREEQGLERGRLAGLVLGQSDV